jgi:hypothetical protein
MKIRTTQITPIKIAETYSKEFSKKSKDLPEPPIDRKEDGKGEIIDLYA